MTMFSYYTKPNFAIAQTKGKVHRKTGLTVRTRTDKRMLDECLKNYDAVPMVRGDVVLDLGANIGGFASMAIKKGCQVIAVEADKFNYELLQHNVGANCQTILGAVVGDDSKTVSFGMKCNANSQCSGKIIQKSRKDIRETEVQAINFNSLIDLWKPTVVKIDVEGYEYFILDKPIDPCVKYLAAEIHAMTIDNSQRAARLLKALEKEWEIIYESVDGFYGNVNLLNLVFRRKAVVDNSAELALVSAEVPGVKLKLTHAGFGQYVFS